MSAGHPAMPKVGNILFPAKGIFALFSENAGLSLQMESEDVLSYSQALRIVNTSL